MKTTHINNGSKWLRIIPDVTSSGRPELTYGNDDIKPYWRATGTGTERIVIEKEIDGSYLIRSFNQAQDANTGKETWIHLDKEIAKRVGLFLQGLEQPPVDKPGVPTYPAFNRDGKAVRVTIPENERPE